jgi:hypothetical protein
MDHSQPRTLPPVDRIETERPWAASHESAYSGLPRETYHEAPPQHRDLLRTTEPESIHDAPNQALLNVADHPDEFKPSSTTRTTAAGVQVDPKKRKRQFANRTKTGCGTCRRRKKKCDEGKPECVFITLSRSPCSCILTNSQATIVNAEASFVKVMPTRFHGPKMVHRNRTLPLYPRIDSR